MNPLRMFQPVRGLYVPSGWLVVKNHLFYIDLVSITELKDEQDRFNVTETFVDDCIFLARFERQTTSSRILSATVDVGSHLTDGTVFYDVNLWVHQISRKKQRLIYECTKRAEDPDAAALLASEFMQGISHEDLVNLSSGELTSTT